MIFSETFESALKNEEAMLRQIEQLYSDEVEDSLVEMDGEDVLPPQNQPSDLFWKTVHTLYPSETISNWYSRFGERKGRVGARRWVCELVDAASDSGASTTDDTFVDDLRTPLPRSPNTGQKRPTAYEQPPPKRTKRILEVPRVTELFVVGSDEVEDAGCVRRRSAPPAASERSVETLATEEKEDILELLEMQFDFRDTSIDPNGKLFWNDVRGRFPDLDVATTAKILKQRRHTRKRSKKRLLKHQGVIPERCLAAMEGLVSVFADLDEAKRLDAVESIYTDFTGPQPMPQKPAIKAFWATLRGFLTAELVKNFPEKLVARHRTTKRSDMARMGLDRNGVVKEHIRIRKVSLPLTNKTETNQGQFAATLPFLTTGSFSKEIDGLKELNKELVKELLTTKDGGTVNKAHKGFSLGKTVVSGGQYSSRKKGISGSIHWNPALRKKGSLQRAVFTKVKRVIREAFGRKKWFKDSRNGTGFP